MLVLTTLDFRK